MKNFKLLLVVITLNIIFCSVSFAQVDTVWTRRYNGPTNTNDYAYSVAVDGQGNVYVTGTSDGSGTGSDYATIKYNSSGVQQWVQRYNGPGNSTDEASPIAVDSAGNVYVTGRSIGSGTGSDYATVKYNSSGIEQWVRRYNGTDNDYDRANAIAIDDSGNIYVTGYSISTASSSDYTTIKYNSSGVEQWVRKYNGTGNIYDVANSITVDRHGNVYVTGNSSRSGTNYDYATVKYNSAGVQQWVQRYNGPGNNGGDYAYSVSVDELGNVYVTGYSASSPTSPFNYDCVTIKYDSLGIEQWVQRYNGPGNSDDYANSIAIDNLGNVYVTGSSYGSGTDRDYVTIKYNSLGIEQWVQRYNGPGNYLDVANTIKVDNLSNIYVTGNSSSTPAGAPNHDYATIKYDSSGVEQWVQRYNGTANSSDIASSIALDGQGIIYVSGRSYGSGSLYDYLTIKYKQDIHDIGVTEIIQPIGNVDSTGKIAPKVKVINNGNVVESFFDIYFETSGGYSNTKSVSTFDIGEERIIEFDSMVIGPRGSYTTRCSTYVVNDINHSNNVLGGVFIVAVHDVGVGEIMHPTANIDSTHKVPVKAKVFNNGNMPESFFDVYFKIDAGRSYSGVCTVNNLQVGEEREIEFDSLVVGPRGTYTTQCSTDLEIDMVSGNNVLRDSFKVMTYDAGVIAIDTPLTSHDKRVPFTPTATVFNNSSQAEDVPVIMEIWKDAVGINEGFESTTFPPAGWAVYNNDGGSNTWYRNQSAPHSGTAHIICVWEAYPRQNDDWIVTKQHLVKPGDSFKFWYRGHDINYFEQLTVRISTASNAISDFTTRLDSFGFNNLTYLEKKISLDAYAGQNVYLAIINRGLARYYLRVDDVSVGYHPQSLVYRDSVMAVGVGGSDANAQVLFKPCTLNIDGGYQAVCYTKLPGDMNTANDQMTKNFAVNPIPLTLNSPNNGITTNDNTPWFDWNDVANVSHYRIQFDDNSNFASPAINELIINSEYQVVSDVALTDGLYFWHVRSESIGTDDPYSETRTLTIDTQGPVAPVLVAPANGLTTNDQTPLFDWNSVGDAVLYNLLVETGKTIVINETLAGTDYTPLTNFGEGSYTWKVKAKDANENWGDYSTAWIFTIDISGPTAPELISPANNYTTNDTLPIFVWHDNLDADSFNLVINTAKTEITNIVITDTFYSMTSALVQGSYTWQVRAKDSIGNWGNFSALWTLVIDITPPNIPTLLFPVDSLITNNTTPEFSWSFVTGAVNYNLVVDDGRKTDVINIETSSQGYTPVTPLNEGVYAWSVKAQDIAGNWSDFAPTNMFTLDTTPPVAPNLLTPPNNAITNIRQVEFTWDSVPDAKFYNVIVESGKWIVCDETASATRFISFPLPEGFYSWKAKSRDWAGNWGEYSSSWVFTVDTTPPGIPITITPIEAETLRTDIQTFTWNQVYDAVEYELSVAETKTTYLTDQTSYSLNLGSGNWTYQVRARDAYGNWSEYSTPVNFTVTLPTWVLAESLPYAIPVKMKGVKDGAAMVAVGDEIWALIGNKSKRFLSRSEITDAHAWVDHDTTLFGLKPPDLVKVNKKVFGKGAAMAYDGENIIYAIKGNSTREFWAYYIDTVFGPAGETISGWQPKAFVPVAKACKDGSSILYKDGKVYLLVGNQKVGMPNFFVYDPAGDTALGTPWTQLTSAITSPDSKMFKDGSDICAIGNTIYVLKGKGKHNYFYAYDIAGDTLLGTPWIEAETIPLVHPQILKKVKPGSGASITTDGTVIYAIKGNGKQDFWMYTPGTPGVWSPLESIPRLHKKSVVKNGGSIVYANGYVWLMKGNNGLEFWRYNPMAVPVATSTPVAVNAVMTEKTSTLTNINLTITPNPVVRTAVVSYNVPVSGKVSLKLYNAMGNVVETLTEGTVNAGSYNMTLNANALAKGVYFLKYESDINRTEIKLVVQ